MAIRGLNQFSNFCGFLEGPHIDILSAVWRERNGRADPGLLVHVGARHPGLLLPQGRRARSSQLERYQMPRGSSPT